MQHPTSEPTTHSSRAPSYHDYEEPITWKNGTEPWKGESAGETSDDVPLCSGALPVEHPPGESATHSSRAPSSHGHEGGGTSKDGTKQGKGEGVGEAPGDGSEHATNASKGKGPM